MTRSIHRIQKRVTDRTKSYLHQSLESGFVPIDVGTAGFIVCALSPKLALRRAQEILTPEELNDWKEGNPSWRQDLIKRAELEIGDSLLPADFLWTLARLYTEETKREGTK